MNIVFAGAARTVTGSCHLLQADDYLLLVDCGLFQGGRAIESLNAEPFPFEAADVNAVVLTHGHLDHVGRLPLLVKRGYSGPVYCTAATAEVAAIILEDAAKIQEEDHARELLRAKRAGREHEIKGPLYTAGEVEKALGMLKVVAFEKWFDAGPLRLRLRPAGHILGSAYVEVEGEGKRVVFSGDLGNRENALHPPAAAPDPCDLLVIESTYADRNHRTRAETRAEFRSVLADSLARGGNVLVPTFAVERTQQVLYELRAFEEEGGPRGVPTYLDAPMATKVTDLYRRFTEELRDEVRAVQARGDDPFSPSALLATPDVEASKKINEIESGAVIIAGSGMMTGGRIVHHLKHNLWREAANLVVVGYQAEGSLGRTLVDGAQRVRIHGEEIVVRAGVHTINGFSAHADRGDLLAFIRPARPGRIALVHGEERVMDAFAAGLGAEGFVVSAPSLGSSLSV